MKFSQEIKDYIFRNGEKSEKPINPVCEGLEEEIETRWKTLHNAGNEIPLDTFNGIARHFYELGRQSKPKVSEDLEEASKEYASHINSNECLYTYTDFTDAFKEGASWQKEKMMKQLRSYCLGEIKRFPESNDASRATRETYYDIIGYLDKNYGCK